MYKVFTIEEIGTLNSNRFSGAPETVRRNIAGTEFITRLNTGVEPLEGETFLSHSEALALMDTAEWKQEEII